MKELDKFIAEDKEEEIEEPPEEKAEKIGEGENNVAKKEIAEEKEIKKD